MANRKTTSPRVPETVELFQTLGATAPAPTMEDCDDPWCTLPAGCPICGSLLTPRDKSNHWHSHLAYGGFWHNVKPVTDKIIEVTIVCDWDRTQRRTVPQEELVLEVSPKSREDDSQFAKWAERRLPGLVLQPTVEEFLRKHGGQGVLPFTLPELEIIPTCGEFTLGQAMGDEKIEISSWTRADRGKSEGTLNHELAHIIVNRCRLKQSDPHGEWFIETLKAVAPATWHLDRDGHLTPEMDKLRRAIHPGSRIISP